MAINKGSLVVRPSILTTSKGGLILKGIYYVNGPCAIQILLGRVT